MLQAGFTAALGIKAQQQRMDVLSGNVANVNTNGYKSEHVEFRGALDERSRIHSYMCRRDRYRVGAQEQLKTYCEILGIKMHTIYKPEELADTLAELQDTDVVFLDTAGKVPGDAEYQREIAGLVKACLLYTSCRLHHRRGWKQDGRRQHHRIVGSGGAGNRKDQRKRSGIRLLWRDFRVYCRADRNRAG